MGRASGPAMLQCNSKMQQQATSLGLTRMRHIGNSNNSYFILRIRQMCGSIGLKLRMKNCHRGNCSKIQNSTFFATGTLQQEGHP